MKKYYFSNVFFRIDCFWDGFYFGLIILINVKSKEFYGSLHSKYVNPFVRSNDAFKIRSQLY